MKTANNASITKAIKNATGYEGIKVSKAGGCIRFYVDLDVVSSEQGLDLSMGDAMYYPRISMLTVAEWVEEFVCYISELGFPTKREAV